MHKELEEKLYKKYPELFKEKDWDISESCMPWGMEFGDGWYWIMDTLCSAITVYCKNTKLELPRFGQVKEKFGELRVYSDNIDPKIDGMIFLAELQSMKTCENCGAQDESVKTAGRGHIVTFCEECREKINKKWEK